MRRGGYVREKIRAAKRRRVAKPGRSAPRRKRNPFLHVGDLVVLSPAGKRAAAEGYYTLPPSARGVVRDVADGRVLVEWSAGGRHGNQWMPVRDVRVFTGRSKGNRQRANPRRVQIDQPGVYYDLLSAMDGWEKSWIPFREYGTVTEARRAAKGHYESYVAEIARAYGVGVSTIRRAGPGLSATFDIIREKFKEAGRAPPRFRGPPARR